MNFTSNAREEKQKYMNGLYQTKSLLHSKRNSQQNRQPGEWEKIFGMFVLDSHDSCVLRHLDVRCRGN